MSHKCAGDKAAVVNGRYISGCATCLNTKKQASLYARKWQRDRMKEDHRKDLLQRYDGDKLNPDFVKEHEQQIKEQYGQKRLEDVLRG